jgi:hypothetical protein
VGANADDVRATDQGMFKKASCLPQASKAADYDTGSRHVPLAAPVMNLHQFSDLVETVVLTP